VPAIFGFVLERKAHPHWFATLGLGLVVAVVAVLGMSTLVNFTDGDPILPNNAVAWRETLEYVASIALAYLLGAMLARAVRPRSARSGRRMTRVATFIAVHVTGKKGGKPLEVRVQQMIKLIQLGISVSTALGAVYTGFKSIL
jgi:Flp pilus assembly protein TadB